MLYHPNERIDAIWKEAQDSLFASQKRKYRSPVETVIFPALLLSFLLCMTFQTFKLFLFATPVFLILLSWSASISAERNNGGPNDPDYFMPFIMRMVGEILSDDWGEYAFTSCNGNRAITLLFHSDADGEDKKREIFYDRVYDTGEDSCDYRQMYIFLGHPLLSIANCRWKEDSPYPELKKRLNQICTGKSTVFNGAEHWRFFVDLEDFKGKHFVDIDEYSRERWFAFARDLAVSVKDIADRALHEMDAIFHESAEYRT